MKVIQNYVVIFVIFGFDEKKIHKFLKKIIRLVYKISRESRVEKNKSHNITQPVNRVQLS